MRYHRAGSDPEPLIVLSIGMVAGAVLAVALLLAMVR